MTADEQGRITVTSLDVAEKFGKSHRDVLKAIDSLELPEDFTSANFCAFVVERPMPRGGGVRRDRAYTMTRDGFALLVMGYTGQKAMEWKVRYIQAFNAMEAELKRREEARLKAQAEQAMAALEREAWDFKAPKFRKSADLGHRSRWCREIFRHLHPTKAEKSAHMDQTAKWLEFNKLSGVPTFRLS